MGFGASGLFALINDIKEFEEKNLGFEPSCVFVFFSEC